MPDLTINFEKEAENIFSKVTLEKPFYSEKNQKYLIKSLEDYKAGKLTQHDLIEAEDE